MQAIPPAYGYVEYLREEWGHLVVAGWMLGLEGGFDAFEIRLADGRTHEAELRERPEMADLFPHIPAAERSGFRAYGVLPPLGPDETFEFTVLGVRGGRPVRSMRVGYHRPRREARFPPPEVMRRASGDALPAFWEATGIKGCNDVRRVLARHVELHRVGRLLEWGCGAGRVTRHLIDRFPWARVHGTDIDADAIAWARAHLEGEFAVCATSPPLVYGDATFDVIVSLSVFTHLTLESQAEWLRELRRVLKPGGILLATTHGEFAGRWLLPRAAEYEAVFADGFHDATRDETLGAVASGEYYRATYQTREHTEREWSRHLDVIDFVQGGSNNLQDVFVLRRPASNG